MRKIPFRNYIIAVCIMILTLLLTFIAVKTYLDSQNLNNENYMNFLSEVMPEELDSYIIDNHDTIIYMTNIEETNKKIDAKVQKILTNNEHIKDTIYLNLNNVDDSFYDNFASKYNIDKSLLKSNSFILIQEGEVVKVINLNEKNIKKLHQYIDDFYGE